MTKTLAIITAVVVCAGCSTAAERVEDRAEPLIRQAIAEKRAQNDRQLDRWRLYQQLADLAGCNLSKGAIERNATEEERAKLDALTC